MVGYYQEDGNQKNPLNPIRPKTHYIEKFCNDFNVVMFFFCLFVTGPYDRYVLGYF